MTRKTSLYINILCFKYYFLSISATQIFINKYELRYMNNEKKNVTLYKKYFS